MASQEIDVRAGDVCLVRFEDPTAARTDEAAPAADPRGAEAAAGSAR